jgi:hypothetical protein
MPRATSARATVETTLARRFARTLVEVGVRQEQMHRHGLAEDRVAEELQALVVRDPPFS